MILRISSADLSQLCKTLAVSRQRARRKRVGPARRFADFRTLSWGRADVAMVTAGSQQNMVDLGASSSKKHVTRLPSVSPRELTILAPLRCSCSVLECERKRTPLAILTRCLPGPPSTTPPALGLPSSPSRPSRCRCFRFLHVHRRSNVLSKMDDNGNHEHLLPRGRSFWLPPHYPPNFEPFSLRLETPQGGF